MRKRESVQQEVMSGYWVYENEKGFWIAKQDIKEYTGPFASREIAENFVKWHLRDEKAIYPAPYHPQAHSG